MHVFEIMMFLKIRRTVLGLAVVPVLLSWHVAAMGSDSNSTAQSDSNNTLFTIGEEGRCTDVLYGSPVDSSKAQPEIVCNTYNAQKKCVGNSLCIWRNDR